MSQSKIYHLLKTSGNHGSDNKLHVNLGKVSNKLAEKVKNDTGVDILNYSFGIDEASIRHVKKHHPNIDDQEFLLIPFILTYPDEIRLGNTKNSIVFIKKFENVYFYVQEIRTGRKKVMMKTFYKRKRPL